MNFARRMNDMPLVKRCCICGRIANRPHSAIPYKNNGWACDKCYIEQVVPSKKWKGNKYNRYGKTKTNKL